jgi:opacity protein-like surface antigen
MKRFLILAAIAAATATTSALAADVGVSVSIGEPGFYGRLDIGGYPQPQVMYRQPVVIEREVSGPPIYMRVPPGHAKNWRKHCREYNACGERVYFVQDSWYSREYVPRYQEQHRDRRDDRRGNNWNDGKGKGNDNGKGNNGRGNGRD